MQNNFTELDKIKGFGKDVNDYLNHYITVADAKSGALFASNFIVLGALYDIDFSKITFCVLKIFYILIILSSLISIIISLYSIYPRLNYDKKKGLIFWENIQNFDNIDEYLDSYKKQTEINKEEAYAKQNYFVSKILKEKNAQIRNSIYFFGLSITLGIISLIIFKIIS